MTDDTTTPAPTTGVITLGPRMAAKAAAEPAQPAAGDETADATPTQGPQAASSGAPYAIDQAALAAGADPEVWGEELAALIQATTGTAIDAEVFVTWLSGFGGKVRTQVLRESAFTVANYSMPVSPSGDPGFLLLDFRQELANLFRKRITVGQ